MKPTVPVLLVFFLCLFAAIDIRASVLTVTKTADTSDGICDADCSLREAVTAAASGDTVVFSTLFESPQTITLTLGQITINKNLTITGTGQTLTTISGNLTGRIFYIPGNFNVTMFGMKLRDGKVGISFDDALGGAIRVVDGGNLSLLHMEFTNNIAFTADPFLFGRGSAVYCFGCTMTLVNLNVHNNLGYSAAIHGDSAVINIRDSQLDSNIVGLSASNVNMRNTTVTGNHTGVSAGVLTLASSIINNNGRGVTAGSNLSSGVTITDSIISENTNGGLDNSGHATIRNCLISKNSYSDSGGGIGNGGTMYIIDSAIVANSASVHGGGIANYGNLFLTNSTVSGNIAFGAMSTAGLGGGIYFEGANSNERITITNSTISNNKSKGEGGGIRRVSGGVAAVGNSIIAGNTSTFTNDEDASGAFMSQGNNLIGNTTGGKGWIASDLLNVNPSLAQLGNNGNSTFTHALLPNSPAVNAGNNSLAVDPQTMQPLTQDQRGFVRIASGNSSRVDIGAYEASYSVSPVTISGRITTSSGRGIDRTRIKIDDGNGSILYTQTNPFGYFRFVNLIPGITYASTITNKSSLFIFDSPQFFTVDQNRSDLNFITGL